MDDSDLSSPPIERSVIRRSSSSEPRIGNGRRDSTRRYSIYEEKHHPICPFCTTYFPILSKNECFRDLCDYYIDLNQSLQNNPIYIAIQWLWSIIMLALAPLMLIFRIYSMLVIQPILTGLKYILHILKLYDGLVKFVKLTRHKLDQWLDSLFDAAGKVYKYLQGKKKEMWEDLEKGWGKLSGDIEKMLVNLTIGAKRIYSYFVDVYELVFPKKVRETWERIVFKIRKVLQTIWTILKNIVNYLVKLLNIAIETWKKSKITPLPKNTLEEESFDVMKSKDETSERKRNRGDESSKRKSSTSDQPSRQRNEKSKLRSPKKFEILATTYEENSDLNELMDHSTPVTIREAGKSPNSRTSPLKMDISPNSTGDKLSFVRSRNSAVIHDLSENSSDQFNSSKSMDSPLNSDTSIDTTKNRSRFTLSRASSRTNKSADSTKDKSNSGFWSSLLRG